jgi:hypothetical protein
MGRSSSVRFVANAGHAVKEKQLQRQVALNLEIKKLQAERTHALALLG